MGQVEPALILPKPPPGTPWPIKMLWYATDIALSQLAVRQFDYSDTINPVGTSEADGGVEEWRHIQVVVADTVSQDPADDQAFTFDVVNYTGQDIDISWTTADYDAVHAQLVNFIGILLPFTGAGKQFVEARYYRRAFNAITEPKPFPNAGAPEVIRTIGLTSTGEGGIPPGNCTTVTEITPNRKNWGRFYCPTIAASSLATTGRLQATVVDAIANGYAQMVANLYGDEFHVVVPTTSVGGRRNDALRGDYEVNPVRTLQAVTAIRVDDVCDYQHRRRHKSALHKFTNSG
jgi:hypothetical protein